MDLVAQPSLRADAAADPINKHALARVDSLIKKDTSQS
jgi:hypothetical protein